MSSNKDKYGTYYIYCIVSDLSDRLYIGSSYDPDRRFRKHLRQLIKGTHHSYKLQQHFTADKPTLSLKILLECKPEDTEYMELSYILAYNSVTKGFNVRYNTLRNPPRRHIR